MLQKLSIRNYAIIDQLSLEPDNHLNIVTGETGAGKSIILGALSLILGERADTSVLINKEEKCVVEAHFDVKKNTAFRTALKAEELDDDDICIIRREITANGKSRAFINDTPVTLNILNTLTSLLVDLHQQFDHLSLENDQFQVDVLDAIAQNAGLIKDYQVTFTSYKQISQQLSELTGRQAQWQKEADYKKFLLEELEQAAFKTDEVEDAEQQLKQLNHAERIIGILEGGRLLLNEGEQPLTNEIKRLGQQLQSIEDVMPDVADLNKRLNSAYAELKDIAEELDRLENKISLNPALMQQLQDKVDIGYKLFKKHGVQSTTQLLSLQNQLQDDLKASLDLDDAITKAATQKEKLSKELQLSAKKLSAARQKVIPGITAKVNELLALVGMPNARFQISLDTLVQPAITGIDKIQFQLDANKSGQFLSIHKAASGGEMSRIMLCIKSLTAKAMELPTLIFDEVDTGISGEAARQVSILLRDLSHYHQVICITHQPQVAAKGSCHFYVYKDAAKNDKITTKVRTLAPDERILAIARMIGGEQPSDAALQNARELVTV